ncbi:hypothetical protein C8J57DRAFT_1245173 [Mycena rebaudengoi]|nr:hypothetical protein C8J57DRAFT_1251730 [Mycena rebaudengoi]KAJ7240733.1 hypothetical protein C8J57DRAFT_1245173 [Mycena rebaudengoi]
MDRTSTSAGWLARRGPNLVHIHIVYCEAVGDANYLTQDGRMEVRMDTGIPAGTFGPTRTRTRKNRTRVRVGAVKCRLLNTSISRDICVVLGPNALALLGAACWYQVVYPKQVTASPTSQTKQAAERGGGHAVASEFLRTEQPDIKTRGYTGRVHGLSTGLRSRPVPVPAHTRGYKPAGVPATRVHP